jgi:membrane fusion protein (multidrug efflux system)
MPLDESELPAAGQDGRSGQDHGSPEPDGRPRERESTSQSKPGAPAARTDSADQQGAAAKDTKDGNGGTAAKPRSKTPLIVLAVIVVAVAIIAFFIWFAHRNQISTDDAYTDGNTVVMAPKVSGYVVALFVNDNLQVRKGDLLLRIDPADYLAAQAQARAQLDLAKAQLASAQTALQIAKVQFPAQYASARAQRQSAAATLAQAQAQYRREHEVDRRATTQENIDAATSQELGAAASLESAEAQVQIAALVPEQIEQAANAVVQRQAQVEQADAQLAQANLNVGYTEVRAPVDGFITMRSAQLGSYLTAGQSMFLLVPLDAWVTANFKESQIGRMRPGDSVDLEIDAYSGYELHGHVQSIQYGSGSKFSAFPAENATGNFVKIVQRIPVKIVIDNLDPKRPLPLGLSVTPTVYLP